MKTKVKINNPPTIKKCLILFATMIFLLLASCSKDEETLYEPIEPNKEKAQGITFLKDSGLKATSIRFRLKVSYSPGDGKEYGFNVNTKGYHIKLPEGTYLMYQKKLFNGSTEIPFNAVIKDGKGGQTPLKNTSLIKVEKDKLIVIVLTQ